MAPLLEAENLKKYFPTGASKLLLRPTAEVLAVDDISFTLEPGRTLGIVGESGCGKSTLGRVLSMLLRPTSGAVRMNGVDLGSLSNKELNAMRRDIQMVFQDPYACLNPRHSIGESITTPMNVQKVLDKQGRRARVQELMDLVGLNPEHYNRFPDEVAVMYLGKFAEYGDAASVYKSPRHPYTKALMSAAPVPDPVAGRKHKRIMLTGDVPSPVNPPSGCRFRTRCWKATDLCAAEEPQLVQVAVGHKVACHFPEPEAS